MNNKFETLVDEVRDLVASLSSSSPSDFIDSLKNLADASTELVPPLNAEPWRLERGPWAGRIGLRWPSGAFAHNDWEIDRNSIRETYDFYGIEKADRIIW